MAFESPNSHPRCQTAAATYWVPIFILTSPFGSGGTNGWKPKPMHRPYGAIYDIANPQPGALVLRFQDTASADYSRWLQLDNVLPSTVIGILEFHMTPAFPLLIKSQ